MIAFAGFVFIRAFVSCAISTTSTSWGSRSSASAFVRPRSIVGNFRVGRALTDALQRFGIDVRRSRACVAGLWGHHDDGGLAAARFADDALWRLLAAVARNKPANPYR